MCPVATVLESAVVLANVKTLIFLKCLERKKICNRKVYKAMEASFQNVTTQSEQVTL